jgi:predicted ATPase
MQLTRLSIENFKGICNRVEVSLRPITLLFGANSVGKSTLLQALLYFRELLERQNVDADRLLVSGTSIDLGGFRQFVHKHDLSRKVSIGVTVTADDDGLPVYPTPGLRMEGDPLAESIGEPVYTVTVEIEVSWDDNTARPWITAYRVAINDRRVGTIIAEPGLKAGLTELDFDHTIFGPVQGSYREVIERSELHTAISALWADHCFPAEANRPTYIPLGASVIPTWGKALPFLEDAPSAEIGPPDDDEDATNRAYAYCGLSSIFVGAGELILRHLQRLRYIGPLRTIPERGFLARNSPSADRWADGSAAWDLLHKSVAGIEASEILGKTSSIIADADKLNLGYRLEGRAILEVPARGFALNTLQALAQSAEDAEVEARLKLVLDDLRSQPRRTQLALIDLKSETEVDPIDIGAGVTQSIPIVVGVLDPHAGIVVVEQPELHTHPAVQCNLGDLFAHAMNADRDRLFLVETHSEHLLLRLLRRVREANENSLAANAPGIKPEDLSVLYIASTIDGTAITDLPVNAAGDFNRQWPQGFFEERAGELF